MSGNSWTHRVSPRNAPRDLEDMQNAARDLAKEANHTKGRTGLVFQNVAQVTILATIVASGALAFLHLWKELSRAHAIGHCSGNEELNHHRRSHDNTVHTGRG